MRNKILSFALLAAGFFIEKGFAEESAVEIVAQDQYPGVYSLYSSFGMYVFDVQLTCLGDSLFVYLPGEADTPYELLAAETGGFQVRAFPGFQINFVKTPLGNVEVDVLTPYGSYRGYKQI
jgi:hypothetical protein